MKFLPIFFLTVFLSSCYYDPGPPEIRVIIDKSLTSKIDSVFLIDNTQASDLKQTHFVKNINNESEYSFNTFEKIVRIKLKLDNNQEILSDSFSIDKKKTKIIVKRIEKGFEFNKD